MQIDTDRLVRLYKAYPLTVIELAARADVSRQAIHLILSGKTIEPKPSTVRAIAGALGVPVSELAKADEEAA